MKKKTIKYFMLMQRVSGRGEIWRPCPIENPRVYKHKYLFEKQDDALNRFIKSGCRKIVSVKITF